MYLWRHLWWTIAYFNNAYFKEIFKEEKIIALHDVENKQLKEENEKVESRKEENEKLKKKMNN